jgi:DNA primase
VSASNSGGDFKSQVLAAVDIVEVIGRTVALKRRGKDFVGLCPFHQEKTPSFYVSPAKQIFHCYGCKAGSSVIDFVMKRDRIEFIDALKWLGEQAGLEMPKFGLSKQKPGERQLLVEINSAACAFFEKLLSEPQRGKAARDYLAGRGIDEGSVRRFQIGLAADAWDALLSGPVGRKYGPGQLFAAGLVKARDGGEGHYDTFRNRLMFPIRDENSRVIAFGGRVMPGSTDAAKYLNSPETPLFSKGRCLFGLDLARQRIVETRTAVVVEGYTDVVMAHQFGVSNVVSPLGTAITEQHVGILRRFADRIVLLFDADAAGDAAVDKAVALFLTQPVEIAIASMPPGVDPDEYLLKNGAEAFETLLRAAADALTFKWKQFERQFAQSANNLTGQQQAVERYLEAVANARGAGPVDPIRWGAALARVSRLAGIGVDELNRRFRVKPTRGGSRNRQTTPGPAVSAESAQSGAAPTSPAAPASTVQRASRWVLGVLLVEPQRWGRVQRELGPEAFDEGPARRLAEMYWEHQREEGEPVMSEFLGLLGDSALVELAIACVDEVEQLADMELTLKEGLLHLGPVRKGHEERRKLIAQSRRTSGEAMSDEEEILMFKRLQAQTSQADPWRV